jgi:hypothetical protein
MEHLRVLELFGTLPPRHVAALYDAAAVIDLGGLPRGLWLGRTGGGTRVYKWLARNVVRRDYFAKLVFDDWGINLRVAQDGSYAPRLDARHRPRIDLPFAIHWDTLNYGYHVLGQDLAQPPLAMQDEMRAIPLAEVIERLPGAWGEGLRRDLQRVREAREAAGGAGAGAAPSGGPGGRFGGGGRAVSASHLHGFEKRSSLLLIGYIVPFGIHRLRGTPFAMAFHRRARPEEQKAARRYVQRARILDTSAGPCRARARERGPAVVPLCP